MGTFGGTNMGGNKNVNNRPRKIRNVKNLGVDISSIQQSPIWRPGGTKRAGSWSPCTGVTPTTHTTPTSPFVHACWHNLDDAQKEQTVGLDQHLVNASWILLRRRAACLFTARAVRSASDNKKQSLTMALAVASKEKEIGDLIKQEQLGQECLSPRRAIPRRFAINTRHLNKRHCIPVPARSPTMRACGSPKL